MKTLTETLSIINKNISSKKISNALKSIKAELELFSNLPDEVITLQAYCVKYNFYSYPLCPECNSNKLKFISFESGFTEFCSYKCEKHFEENNGTIIEKNVLIKKLKEIYQKVKGPIYEKFVLENKLLYSLKIYTNFLPEDCKVTERIYCIMENINERQICKHCGVNKTKYKNFIIGYTEFCSTKCSSNSESKKSQISETNLVKYGHENAFRSDIGNELRAEFYSDKDRIQKAVEKGTATKIANHGEDVFKLIAIKASNTKSNTIINGESMHDFSSRKGMETKLLKYGRSRMSNPELFYGNKRRNFIINRTEELKKKGIECNFSLDDYKGTNIEYQWKCTSCNSFFEKAITGQEPFPICPICNKKEYTVSKGEDSLANYILSLNVNLENRDRKMIAPKEIDILIPSKKIGIEYNGLYFHSFELQSRRNITKQEAINYHLLKTNLAKKKV
jgi:Zn finger protein HypA/HybF involved in hydrogenase expression